MFGRGRGWSVTWPALLAMVLPMIVLRQADGPEVDRGIALTMGLAALVTLWLGLRWNAGGEAGEPARQSFRGLPLPLWAASMLLFAVLHGSGLAPVIGAAPRRDALQPPPP